MAALRTKVIACATVIEEMLPVMPEGMQYEALDFGLHVHPGGLKATLQQAIDRSSQEADIILLGYGLCSLAVVGLKSGASTVVIPRADDCIALFLGSQAAYREQARHEPGTYYLTKGWIEVGDTPFEQYKRLTERYGEQKARRMVDFMLKHYRRLAFINTGNYDMERYREYARRTAEEFNLAYEEIQGSDGLVTKLLFGPWDEEFVVVPPNGQIAYEDFAGASAGVSQAQ